MTMADKLNVGLVSRTFFNLPLWTAMENGGFTRRESRGHDRNSGQCLADAAAARRQFQVFIGGPEAVHPERQRRRPAADRRRKHRQADPFADRARRLSRIEDLRGRPSASSAKVEGTFFQLKEMLEAHGLNYPGDYQVKDTGGVPPRHKALLAGEIDAGLQSVPWNYVAEEVGMNNLGDVIEYVPDWQFVSINANSQWAEANRDVLVRFLRALRATEWLYANRGAIGASPSANCRAAAARGARVGPLHRHQRADPRHGGQPQGAGQGDRDADGGRAAAERRFDVDSGIHRRRLPARRSAFLARVQWPAHCPEFGFLSWAMRHRM